MKTALGLTISILVAVLLSLAPVWHPHAKRVMADRPSVDTNIRFFGMSQSTSDRLARLLDEISEHYDVPENAKINMRTLDEDKVAENGLYKYADATPKVLGIYVVRIYPLGLEQPDEALKLTLIHELEHVKLFEAGLGETSWSSCHIHLHEALARKAEIRYARATGTLDVKSGLFVVYNFRKSEANRLCVKRHDVAPFMAALAESR